MQALPAQPESLCIVEMGGVEKQDELGDKGSMGFLYLNIGLQVLLRNVSTLYISLHSETEITPAMHENQK